MLNRIMWRSGGWWLVGSLVISGVCLSSWREVNAVENESKQANGTGNIKTVTFGGGCFWCVEAVFEELEGVSSVESGYAGGTLDAPTYEEVCTGTTGHAEVCQIHYDASRIDFTELLEVFFKTHDPTTLNQQGADRGTQYRSVVFYHDKQQKDMAEKYIGLLEKKGVWNTPIVTELTPLPKYFPAEEYHQNYFKRNPFQGYCRVVINPKVKKFRASFRDKLKSTKN